MSTHIDDLKTWLSKVDEKLDTLTGDMHAIKSDIAVIKVHAENRDERLRALEAAQKVTLGYQLERPRKFGWLVVTAVLTLAVSISTSCVSSWITYNRLQKASSISNTGDVK